MTIPKFWPKPRLIFRDQIFRNRYFFSETKFSETDTFFCDQLETKTFFRDQILRNRDSQKKNWNVNLCYRVSQAKVLNRITCAGFATGATFNRSTCSPFPRGIGKPLIYSVRCSDCAKSGDRNFWLGHPVTSYTSPRLYKVIKRRFTKWFENAQFQ